MKAVAGSDLPVVDKSNWGPGAWQDEPDRVDWIHAGYACLATRHPLSGHWCGYVGVDRSHPYYSRPFEDAGDLDGHGGVNYARACDGERICHVPAPGMPDDVWWFGFDCGHGYDLSPGLEARERAMGLPPPPEGFEEYRDLAYVRAVTDGLADQLRLLAIP